MAPNFAEFQHSQIRDMIEGGCRTDTIVETVRCSPRAVQRIRSKLCLLSIEYNDAATLERGVGRRSDTKEDSESNKPPSTLYDLLNAIDGVVSPEGRVIIMTANEPNLLDRALVRPGRVDRKVYLGYMSRKSAWAMFVRILGLAMDEAMIEVPLEMPSSELSGHIKLGEVELGKLADVISCKVQEATFSPVQVQEFLLEQRGNPT
ncbi:Mitochondrial chaperone BCS1 [Apiospora rasikravindrae]|uniref:Mitochondrial chaperone BCS1 n=1 Tax=Apiospora rasikravindrae TaxID=990691 RepID=A0ABR1SC61_9PEZI